MICFPLITDIETPYRLLHDIEENSSDSNNESLVPNIQTEQLNPFFCPESKWAWYLFFGFWVLVLVGCVIYSLVQ